MACAGLGKPNEFVMLIFKRELLILVLLGAISLVSDAPLTVTRASEVVDIYKLRPYDDSAQMKLRGIWQAFRQTYTLTDDGGFEPAIPGADACPDNIEAQNAFLNFIKEKSIEVQVTDYVRCGDCNGTGKRYLREGDSLTSQALEHVPCGGSGKMRAILTYRLIFTGVPPPKLPSKNQLAFASLKKRVDDGDLDAQFELGHYLDAGRGTAKDAKKASELFARCLMRKDPRGALALGGQYERGSDGLEPNRPTSIAFYMLGQYLGGGSANLDNIYRTAQPRDVMQGFWIGRILLKEFKSGKVTAPQLSSAGIRRLVNAQFVGSDGSSSRKDGDQELQDGMVLLSGGDEKKPNLAGAYAKFTQAAACGQGDALYCLGVFHENGLAVARNRSSAYVFYALAATVAGEDYMKVAQKSLDSSCRTEENNAVYLAALDELRAGKLRAERLTEIAALKDADEEVASAGPAVAGKVEFPDIFDPSTGRQLKPGGSGSGLVFNSEGYLFTNHHVVEKGKAFTLKLAGAGPMRRARLVAFDEPFDLAILQIENWKGPSEAGHAVASLAMNASQAAIGRRIFTIGFPVPELLTTAPKYTSGDLSSLTSMWDGRMQVSCPIQPGNSGGPLVGEEGHVLGVICSSVNVDRFYAGTGGTLPQGLNWAIRVEYLRQLAARNSINVPNQALRVVDPPKVIAANSVIIWNWQ
jgi:S1-C subfamily serine protease